MSGNSFTDTTFPVNVEGTWGCQNKTTPNPGGGEGGAVYLLTLQKEEKLIKRSQPPGRSGRSAGTEDDAESL